MAGEVAEKDALAQAELVRRGKITPAELVEAAIARLEGGNPELRAMVTDRFERARAEARGPLPEGAFRGVPLLLKDLGASSAGDPLYEGMGALCRRAYRAPRDSYVVEKLRAAGFVIVGKSATPELGLLPTTEPLAFGATRNPYDRTRSPGGSSGGAAAAVAAGLVPIAHASDGGGSIRIPASCCGLVGLKPSRGRVSLGPARRAIAARLVTEAAVTRSVRDAAALLDVLAGPMPGDLGPLPAPSAPFARAVELDPGRLRVAAFSQFFGPDGRRASPAPAALEALEHAVGLLERAGHRVERTRYPPLEDPDYPRAFRLVWAEMTRASLDGWAPDLGEPLGEREVEPVTWALASLAAASDPQTRRHAWAKLREASRRGLALWRDYDLLLSPTLAEPPPPLGQFFDPETALDRAARLSPYTAPLNVSGEPAISLPLWRDGDGLPIGIQLAAPLGREDCLLAVAAQLERAQPFDHAATRQGRPPVAPTRRRPSAPPAGATGRLTIDHLS
jgi:amidase